MRRTGNAAFYARPDMNGRFFCFKDQPHSPGVMDIRANLISVSDKSSLAAFGGESNPKVGDSSGPHRACGSKPMGRVSRSPVDNAKDSQSSVYWRSDFSQRIRTAPIGPGITCPC
jgi:hypothetical protein